MTEVDQPMREIPSAAVLDALEGVCYITDLAGKIVGIGGRNWTSFAQGAGCDDQLSVAQVLGRDLFAYIAGEDVLQVYRGHISEITANPDAHISFLFRCDSPSVLREMRMNMSGIRDGETTVGVLFQSLTLQERERPPISLFDVAARMKEYFGVVLPIITMCSYCHDVRAPITANQWVRAERYYAAGGDDRVRISHGICPACQKKQLEG